MSAGIYKITNNRTGMVYVGSAVNIESRWNSHRGQLKRGRHSNRQLQRDWNYFGERAFAFSKLEIVHNRAKLHTSEQRWLDHYRKANGLQTVYNLQLRIPSRTRKSVWFGKSRSAKREFDSAAISGCATALLGIAVASIYAFVFLTLFGLVVSVPLILFFSPILVIRMFFQALGAPEQIAWALAFLGGTVPGALLVYGAYKAGVLAALFKSLSNFGKPYLPSENVSMKANEAGQQSPP